MPLRASATHALFTGPAFVLAAVSDNWTSSNFDTPPIGMPACEAWPDEGWVELQARMRSVYRSGVPEALTMASGIFTIMPVEWQGSRALVVELRPSPGTPRPAPRLPDLLASNP